MRDLSSIVDDDGYPRAGYVARRGFRTALLYEIFRLVEAELLGNAIVRLNGPRAPVEAYSYDSGSVVTTRELTPTRDDLCDFVADQNLYHTILTDRDRTYIAHFSQHRDFVLYCGSADFVSAAYPLSGETVKAQYFFNVGIEDQRGRLDNARDRYFQSMWNRYSGTAV